LVCFSHWCNCNPDFIFILCSRIPSKLSWRFYSSSIYSWSLSKAVIRSEDLTFVIGTLLFIQLPSFFGLDTSNGSLMNVDLVLHLYSQNLLPSFDYNENAINEKINAAQQVLESVGVSLLSIKDDQDMTDSCQIIYKNKPVASVCHIMILLLDMLCLLRISFLCSSNKIRLTWRVQFKYYWNMLQMNILLVFIVTMYCLIHF